MRPRQRLKNARRALERTQPPMLARKGARRLASHFGLLLAAIACAPFHGTRGQLATQPAAFNPFSGQGAPPSNLTLAYPVTTTFALTKLLAVDEAAYTFTIRAYWVRSRSSFSSPSRAHYSATSVSRKRS